MKNIKSFLADIIRDTGKGIKGYIKSQLILMVISFAILSIGLMIIRAPLPVLIALGIAILDIIPVIGSGIIMFPWCIINFIIGNTNMGTGLAVLYVVLTIARQILEPKITGDQIGIKPLYTFAATLLGTLLLGPLGAIAGPIAAIIITSVVKKLKIQGK